MAQSADLRERLQSALGSAYALERELGGGGMARVFVATETALGRRVVIKVLPPETSGVVSADRFRQEIQLAARLHHPHVVPVHSAGQAGELLYYTMPFVEGESLRERLTRSGQMPVAEAARILCEVADALSYAHAHGVVHRDVKPENVMLSGRHALVTDFGVAKALAGALADRDADASEQQVVTTVGLALGTPAYMAPEQAVADPLVDYRADLYALGVLGYELLAGRPPFVASTPQGVLAAHVTQEPPPLGTLRPGLPPALEGTLARCLAKRPSDRPQSAEEVLAEVEPFVGASGGGAPATSRPAAPARGLLRGTRLAVAGAVVGAGILAGMATLVVARRAPEPLALGRTTQITFDRGLELEPALSPDGRLVAYVAGPEDRLQLYVRQMAGGRTVQVVDEPGHSHHLPEWSPDGSRLAYQSDSGIYVVPALGGPPRLLVAADGERAAGSPAWSPDGHSIAYTLGDTIFVRPVDGGAARPIAAAPAAMDLAWSADGRRIAYVVGNNLYVFGVQSHANIAPSAVWVMPAAGGAPVRVTDDVSLNMSPAWLPDGSLLIVSNRDGPRDVYRLVLDRSGRPAAPATRLTAGLDPHTIALSADGRRLAYAAYTTTSNVWAVPMPTAGPASVAQATPVTSGNQVIEAMNVSPDGRWLVFDSNRNGNQDIFRMRLPDGEPEQVTSDPADESSPDISPDGRWIAFHSFRNGNRDVFVVPAEGGPARPVAATPLEDRGAYWSPDGARLLFTQHEERRHYTQRVALVARGRDGAWSPPRALMPHAVIEGCGWSPDGRETAYVHVDGSAWVLPLDGGSAQRILGATARRIQPGAEAENCRWARHERMLLSYRRDANTYDEIIAIPVAGGEPRALVRFDDPARPSRRSLITVDSSRVYFLLDDRQSDIWTAELPPPR